MERFLRVITKRFLSRPMKWEKNQYYSKYKKEILIIAFSIHNFVMLGAIINLWHNIYIRIKLWRKTNESWSNS